MKVLSVKITVPQLLCRLQTYGNSAVVATAPTADSPCMATLFVPREFISLFLIFCHKYSVYLC